jgi:hypothetical protein
VEVIDVLGDHQQVVAEPSFEVRKGMVAGLGSTDANAARRAS